MLRWRPWNQATLKSGAALDLICVSRAEQLRYPLESTQFPVRIYPMSQVGYDWGSKTTVTPLEDTRSTPQKPRFTSEFKNHNDISLFNLPNSPRKCHVCFMGWHKSLNILSHSRRWWHLALVTAKAVEHDLQIIHYWHGCPNRCGHWGHGMEDASSKTTP